MMRKAESARFWCPRCAAHALLTIEGSYVDRDEGGPPDRYVFGRCVRCNQPGIVVQSYVDGTGETIIWSGGKQIFPETDRTLNYFLPPIVHDSFKAARKCVGNDIACVVMIGRTLEAIAKDCGVTKKNLNDMLNEMNSKGIISAELAEWGHELRFIRNEGAHAGDAPDPQDAADAMEFLEAILETLYFLRPKFQALKARRHPTPPTP